MLPAVRKAIEDRFHTAVASEYAFDFYGLERGGHHAVLNWILELTGEPHMYVTRAHTRHPGCVGYHPSGWFTSHLPDPRGVGLAYRPDQDLEIAPTRIDHRRVIVCVRDIRNVLASRMRWYETQVEPDVHVGNVFTVDGSTVDCWRKYARQALGDVDYFDGRCVPVVFDHWALSRDYRHAVIRDMVDKFEWILPDTPNAAMSRVAQAGGGSSFDGMMMDGSAHRMRVTERWKSYADHPIMTKLLTPEVLDLNSRLLEETRCDS